MHREHIKDFKVMKKPLVVMQYMINKNNCLAKRVNTKWVSPDDDKAADKNEFFQDVHGPWAILPYFGRSIIGPAFQG